MHDPEIHSLNKTTIYARYSAEVICFQNCNVLAGFYKAGAIDISGVNQPFSLPNTLNNITYSALLK